MRSADGRALGINIDQLVLGSAAGGAAAALGTDGRPIPPTVPPAPATRLVDNDATSKRVRVAESDEAVWVVLGESRNEGWEASGSDALGASTLINGFANGWYLGPRSEVADVALEWVPQGLVDIALWASLLGIIVCLVLVARGRAWNASPTVEPPVLAAGARGRRRGGASLVARGVPRRAGIRNLRRRRADTTGGDRRGRGTARRRAHTESARGARCRSAQSGSRSRSPS